MPTKKVTFLVDHTPKGQAPDRPHYRAGEVHTLETSYADKYIGRGLAVDHDPKAERQRKESQDADRLAAEQARKLAARGKVVIPEQPPLEWDVLKELAAQLTDEHIRSRDHAMSVIQDELDRREALAKTP